MNRNNNNACAIHIVDDDEAIRDSLSMLLQSEGLQTFCYNNAQDFLQRYQECGPGCIILDISMQGMTGLELQNVLNDQQIKIPVVFITGHGDEIMYEQAMQAGAFDFIEKPFPVESFLERIKLAVESSYEQRQPNKEINISS